METAFCSKCKRTIYGGAEQLMNHLRRQHAIDLTNHSGFLCGQDGCAKMFVRWRTLKQHLNKKHFKDRINNENGVIAPESPLIPEVPTNSLAVGLNEVSKDEVNPFPVSRKPVLDIAGGACRLVANLRACSSFTGAALSKVIDGTEIYVSELLCSLKNEVTDFLELEGINVSSPRVQSFLDKFEFGEPFKGMESIQGQIEALKKNYAFIDPVEKVLGSRTEQVLDRRTGQYEQKQVPDTFQYVPLIETLKLILSHAFVRDYIDLNSSSDNNGYFESYRDGRSFKAHPFFKRFPKALVIQFYYDDVVVNNPLGSKVHPHKLGTFYFTIQNLPPYINSRLSGIHVLALAYTADILKYGMEPFLTLFMNDLRKLESEDGYPITLLNGEQYILRASLGSVCADGMAAHQLFGLLGPAARHFCRLCMISRQDLRSGSEGPFVPRTRELYDKQVRDVTSNPKTSLSSGVRENSFLHCSKFFHCTENFIFDILHDLWLGCCSMVLKQVLRHMVTTPSYGLNIETFNDRVHLFMYGSPESKNKPSPTFTLPLLQNKDNSLPQKGMQMWLLMRVFPFLVSDKVSEGDEYLELILLLNRITEIAMAPKFTVNVLPYFDELIKEHQRLFQKLFPDVTPINKMHHLSHYPQCLYQCGPIRSNCCLRYEAKHSVFKRFGSICCNFTNIVKTMIQFCQISQCATWGMGEYRREKIKTTKGDNISVCKVSCHDALINQLGLGENDIVFKTDSVEVYGTKYRTKLLVALDSGIGTLQGDPVFGRVEEIIILKNEQVYLWCKEWPVLWLESSLNAYCVEEGIEYRLISTENLCDFKPFALWKDYNSDESYLVLRHMLL